VLFWRPRSCKAQAQLTKANLLQAAEEFDRWLRRPL